MTTPEQRQTCYEYLLEELSPDERAEFESRLAFDSELAAELRRCETDLADFAEASVDELTPPPDRVWANLAGQMRSSPKPPQAGGAGVGAQPPIWKRAVFYWPMAAAILLGFNLWQHFQIAELQSLARQGRPAAVEALAGVERGRETLREHVDSLAVSLAAAGLDPETGEPTDAGAAGAPTAAPDYEALLAERDLLLERVETLEVNFLNVVDVAQALMSEQIANGAGGIGGGRLSTERAIELVAAFGNPDATAAGSVWDRVAERRGDSDIALLSADPFDDPWSSGLVGAGVGQFEPEPEEPYALAFVDPESDQALFSFGDLPALADGEEMVLWIRNDGSEAYVPVGQMPRLPSESASNVAARIPEGYEASSDFALSIETAPVEQLEGPSERIVLRAVSD